MWTGKTGEGFLECLLVRMAVEVVWSSPPDPSETAIALIVIRIKHDKPFDGWHPEVAIGVDHTCWLVFTVRFGVEHSVVCIDGKEFQSAFP